VGEGSSFWLQLGAARPAAPAPDPASPDAANPGEEDQAPQPSRDDGRAQVLYIEDNAVNRLLMDVVFEQLPQAELRMATCAAEGLAMARAAPPQLVLLDIQLPDMDGHALVPLLRAIPALAKVPVIAVSADATPSSLARALAAGFVDYLTKPLDTDRLLALVREVLGQA
jgi:CheY-like chemotaxis protein